MALGHVVNVGFEPGANAKSRLTEEGTRCIGARRECGFRTGGWREVPADQKQRIPTSLKRLEQAPNPQLRWLSA